MKKNILISTTLLASFILMAFGYVNWSNIEKDQVTMPCSSAENLMIDHFTGSIPMAEVELFYDVNSRFATTVSKEDLNNAKSLFDIVPENPNRSILSYYSVTINILDDDYKTVASETGAGPALTVAQILLLQSLEYSTDILIRSEYLEQNTETGEWENRYATPHLTVVPEKQAVCTSGKEGLIAYVKENTKQFSATIDEDKLNPGKVIFVINKEGKVANAFITATSGYPAFDKKMTDLIYSMPGTWEPATNSKGEKVEQKFVFSFGKIGC